MTSKNGKILFHVQPRVGFGGSAKKLHSQKKIAANVYGLKEDSVAVEMDSKAFSSLYAAGGDTSVIYLKVGDNAKEVPVLVDEVQQHPVTNFTQHVVFRRVNLLEKIEAEVAIELIGENEVNDSTVLLVKDSIEVSALPTDLPEKFEIDQSKLTEIGQAITVADLEYDRSKVEIVMTGDMNEETPLAILQEVKEEVVEEAPASVEDVEITTAAEEKEGETPEAEPAPAPEDKKAE